MKLLDKINHRKLWFNSMVGMTWGFLATLIIGTIIGLLALIPEQNFANFILTVKTILIYLTPFAIGVGVALKNNFPPLVILAMMLGVGIAAHSLFIPHFDDHLIVWTPVIGLNILNGPGDILGAWLMSVCLSYLFKIWNTKTFMDLFIIPFVGILSGLLGAFTLIYLTATITAILQLIIFYTINQYHWLAILLAPILGALMGLALSLPISSAAIAFAVGLKGDAATAAIAATSGQMIAFGILTYWATNNLKATIAVTFGSSMLQIHNFVRKPKLLIIPTLTSALAALIAVSAIPLPFMAPSVTSGMGTSALYGQIFTLQENGWANYLAWLNVIVLQLIVPIVLTIPMATFAIKKGIITKKELQLNYA